MRYSGARDGRKENEAEHRKRVKFHHSRSPFMSTNGASPHATVSANGLELLQLNAVSRQHVRRMHQETQTPSRYSESPSSVDVIDIDAPGLQLRPSVARRPDPNLLLQSLNEQHKASKYGTSRSQPRYQLANPPLLMGLIQLHHLCANARRDGVSQSSDGATSISQSVMNTDARRRQLASVARLQQRDARGANNLSVDQGAVYERQVLSPAMGTKRTSSGSGSMLLSAPQVVMTLPNMSSRRRESFLYRDELSQRDSRRRSSVNSQPQLTSKDTASQPYVTATVDDKPRPSIPADLRLLDEPIVTPFAQILATLHSVRAKYSAVAHLPGKRAHKFHGVHLSIGENDVTNDNDNERLTGSQRQEAVEILEDLDWCLDQLETVQSHRSLSDLASSKFKRLLKKELSQLTQAGETGSQVADFISNTYTDKQEEEIESGSPNADGDAARIKANGDDRNADARKNTDVTGGKRDTEGSDHVDVVVTMPQAEGVNMSAITTVESGTGALASNLVGIVSSTAQDVQIQNAFVKPFVGRMAVSLEAVKRCRLVNGKPKFSSWTDENEQEIDEMLKSVNEWGFDIFRLHTITDGHPLVTTVFSILETRGLIGKLKINPLTLLKYTVVVEGHYHRDIPYHTSIHAADVTQSTHVMLSASRFQNAFSDLEVFAAIMASAIHDTDHPGVTNQFLINTGSDLATMYNDESVLENHHLAVSFKILQDADLDFLLGQPTKTRSQYRRLVIDMVLATDMSKHMALLADLKTMVEAKKVARQNNEGASLTLDTYSDKILIMKNLIHCADLSNPSKPLQIYQAWVDRIMEEFFRQGDLERSKGLDISPMCDRFTATVAKSQVGFIDFIVHPLWETWAELVYPDCQPMLDMLAENREWYKQLTV